MSDGTGDIPYMFERHDKFLSLTLKPELNDVQWGEIETLGNNALTGIESYDVPTFIVDLSPLNYMGSAMVALIVRIWKMIKSKGGKMAVVCPNENVHEVLTLAGLDKVWIMTNTQEEAQKELGVKPKLQRAASSNYDEGVSESSSSPALAILAILAVVVGIVGLVLQLAVKSMDPNVGFGIALGGAVMAFLVGIVSLMNDRGGMKYISLVSVMGALGVLIVALINKP